MAEVISISVEGEAQVKAALAKVENGLTERLTLNKELSEELSRKASAMAPRLTGELASSVKGNPSNEKAQILAGGAGVPYAGVQEYGWPAKNIQAQPYLRPAVYDNMGYIVEKYNNYIESIVKKYNLD
jgi:hypothetical protein